jgi:hypothetical protein
MGILNYFSVFFKSNPQTLISGGPGQTAHKQLDHHSLSRIKALLLLAEQQAKKLRAATFLPEK